LSEEIVVASVLVEWIILENEWSIWSLHNGNSDTARVVSNFVNNESIVVTESSLLLVWVLIVAISNPGE